MVIAYHLVWTVYGTWLPNDPRGSGSKAVFDPNIAALGELHFGRRKIQPASSAIREFYERAEPKLKYPVRRFEPGDFSNVADAIGSAVAERSYTCYAAAIMPDHVHLVIRKHRDLAETMIDELQKLSRHRLRSDDHPVWTTGGWKRFLGFPEQIRRVIGYVENNPAEIRLPRQSWAFVTPYDDWPFHKRPRTVNGSRC